MALSRFCLPTPIDPREFILEVTETRHYVPSDVIQLEVYTIYEILILIKPLTIYRK